MCCRVCADFGDSLQYTINELLRNPAIYLGTTVIVKPLLAIAKPVVLQSWSRKHQTCIVRTIPNHVFK